MQEDLEELKRRRLLELQQRLQEERAREEQRQLVELQRRSILTEILTPEARSRLANIKIAKLEYAVQVENLLIQLAQSGQLKQKISDVQLKQILGKISEKKKEFRIRRM
ncbi:MAG: DNA-binding protein [Candidatus Hydrothermarchaeota archaeon]|nr:DNA-binding protein [Candidatus Hydrothermarchaeota archaeon]